MPYDRGDVVLVLYPDSNLRTAKRRPALVVQADNLQAGLPQTIVAMISSNMSRAGHPSRVAVLRGSTEGQQMGLHCDSVLMTDNLATVLDHENRPSHREASADADCRYRSAAHVGTLISTRSDPCDRSPVAVLCA